MIRVVIAEDHHLVRQGLRMLLEQAGDIQVVGEAQDGFEAVKLVDELKPDVVILDINMPKLGGIEAAERMMDLKLSTRVLILSMYSDDSLVKKAFRSKARGYVLKNSASEDLIEGVRQVSNGLMYLSPDLVNEHTTDKKAFLEFLSEDDYLDQLTKREVEVCKLVAEGYTNQNIADELGISVKTVEKHRSSLMEKLGVKDTVHLVREAIRHRIVFVEGK